jgi:hypothetical protein
MVDLTLINDIFSKDKAMIICKLPLSSYKQLDILFWRGTTTGDFIVHSAYHMEMEKEKRDLL